MLAACSGGETAEITTSAASSSETAVSSAEVTESANVVNANTLLGKLLASVKSDNAHIEFMITTENSQMEFEIYISGDKSCLISTDRNGVLIKDLIIGGKSYAVFPDRELYAKLPEGKSSAPGFINNTTILLGMDGSLFFTGVTGEEEFCGEKLYFEEFRRENKTSNLNRFYFKDGVLQGCYPASGATINIYAFDDEIPDGIFEIPEGYAEGTIGESEWEEANTDGV